MHCKFLTIGYELLVKASSAHVRCQSWKHLQTITFQTCFPTWNASLSHISFHLSIQQAFFPTYEL